MGIKILLTLCVRNRIIILLYSAVKESNKQSVVFKTGKLNESLIQRPPTTVYSIERYNKYSIARTIPESRHVTGVSQNTVSLTVIVMLGSLYMYIYNTFITSNKRRLCVQMD